MNTASVVAAFARRWSALYTAGLPIETRARRREEIAGDLWEQLHDDECDQRNHAAVRLAARVCSGMPADLLWRAGERRPMRRLDVANLSIDRTWDRRVRLGGRAVALAVFACLVPIALGLPVLLAVTVPAAALALRQLSRNDKIGAAAVNHATLTRQKRNRFIVVVVAIGVFVLGLAIDSLPSEDMHERYWFLFVAPSMIGLMVAAIALPMLVWSLLPRREGPTA